MQVTVRRTLHDMAPELRHRIVWTYVGLLAANAGLWIATLAMATRYPILLALALPAYTFGLRHAVDADHISAIDNVTRKLISEKKQPVGVGLFFSLGHSTIVVLLSLLVTIVSLLLQSNLSGNITQLRQVGGLIGTSVSAAFLYLIAIINIVVLVGIFRAFTAATRDGTYQEDAIESFLNSRGLLARIFRPMFRLIDASWKMYLVGLLFGLGFDTASEVAILAIAGTTATHAVPVLAIMLLPLLFAAGMSLVDTTDGVMMLGAYGWAFVKPVRKLYYNLVITLVSVLIALVVGTFETLNILASQAHLGGPFWDWVLGINSNFGTLGVIIVATFALSWIASTIIYRLKRYEDLPLATIPASPPTRAGSAPRQSDKSGQDEGTSEDQVVASPTQHEQQKLVHDEQLERERQIAQVPR